MDGDDILDRLRQVPEGVRSRYGLGWTVERDGRRLIHGGDVSGFHALLDGGSVPDPREFAWLRPALVGLAFLTLLYQAWRFLRLPARLRGAEGRKPALRVLGATWGFLPPSLLLCLPAPSPRQRRSRPGVGAGRLRGRPREGSPPRPEFGTLSPRP